MNDWARKRRHARTENASLVASVMLVCVMITSTSHALSGQTFQPTQAIHVQECSTFLGIPTGCSTIQTNRLDRSFTQSKLGTPLFSGTWATATDCTYLPPNSVICQNSLQAWTDPIWGRIVWTYSNSFIHSYGAIGGMTFTPTGTFVQPRGISITQRTGRWHAVFVADAGNNRIVALALNDSSKIVKWLGTLDGHESGVQMHGPHDVAWDPAYSWSLSDDRLFIADTFNHRVLVYHVSLDFTTNVNNPTMTTTYFNSFGSKGSGLAQLLDPQGIAVRSMAGQQTNVFITDTGNGRVSLWGYDGGSSGPQAAFALVASPSLPGSQLVGITIDNFGDPIVADVAKGVIRSFNGNTLIPLKVFGGTSTWSSGNYRRPSKPEVIFAYRQDPNNGALRADMGLPYVGISEQWGDTTGGQLARLGVDADSLAVTAVSGARTATVSFLFTATGSYTASIKNSAGTIVRTLRSNYVTSSGWQTLPWDGKDNSGVLVPYGTYNAVVSFVSGYTYDAGTPRTASKSFTFVAPPTLHVTINGSTTVVKGVAKTWTSTVTNGTSPYTYKWTRNGVTVGTSASYTGSATVCGPFTIVLLVTDALSNTATASIDIDVTGGSPPCAV